MKFLFTVRYRVFENRMSRLLVVESDGKFSTLLHSCSYLIESKLGQANIVHASSSSQEAQAQGSGFLYNLSKEDCKSMGISLSVQMRFFKLLHCGSIAVSLCGVTEAEIRCRLLITLKELSLI